jgi:hypothetical protein
MLLKINKVHFAIMTDFMKQKFSTAVAISEHLIRTAYSNRLSPGALQHDALVEIVKYVNEVATNSDLLSFIHKPSDLFLVETSDIYKPDEKTFILVLHVPLVTPHNVMPLFEFIPLPAYFNFNSNVTVMPEVSSNNMIAVGHSESYQLLSSSDLQNCNKTGGHPFLQREECPPKGLDQNLPRSSLPRQPHQHSNEMQIYSRRGPREDLPFGQSHLRGVFPWEN